MANSLAPIGNDLPAVQTTSEALLSEVLGTLAVDRDLFPSQDSIGHVLINLPRLLGQVPSDLRNEGMVRLCLAASVGLYDSALNYIWNSVVLELRKKVVKFGLPIVGQLTSRSLDEESLSRLQDSELLNLCLELSIISKDGYFRLDQCRAMRNNFSAAHPAQGDLNEDEIIAFISRCVRDVLANSVVPAGVNLSEMITAVRSTEFTEEQASFWKSAVSSTHAAQRALIATSLHGMYCDQSMSAAARTNCLTLFPEAIDSHAVPAQTIDIHQSYVGKGEQQKAAASRDFFSRLGLLGVLSTSEQHAIVSSACDHLMAAHSGMNNFYNEPPFAERLRELVEGFAIPDSVREKFVVSVATCAVGNEYGVSWAAEEHYEAIVRAFSPKAITIFLQLRRGDTIVAQRISSITKCKRKYGSLVALIPAASVPTAAQNEYEEVLRTSPTGG